MRQFLASPLPFIGVFPSFPADASSPLGRGIGGRRPLILVPYALEPAWPHPFSEVDDLLAADSFGRLYLCTFSHLPFVPAGFSIFLGILYLRLSLGGGIRMFFLAVRYYLIGPARLQQSTNIAWETYSYPGGEILLLPPLANKP